MTSGSGSSRFGAYTVVGTVHGDSIQIRKLKNVLPKIRRRRSTKKVEEDASREIDKPKKRKKKKKLAARKPPAEGAQLLVKWPATTGPRGRTVLRGGQLYGDCVLCGGGQLHGDWEEPVPFDADDDATSDLPHEGPHWLTTAGRGATARAYKQLGWTALPRRRRRPRSRRSDKNGSRIPPVEAIGDLVAEMAEFVADNAPEDIQNAYACSLHPAEYLRRWARGDSLLRPLRGLNVQHPWAPMLLDGSKVIEARTYDIDDKGGFGNEWFWVVETPGKQRQRGQRARITGCVKFCREAVRYTSLDQWRADEDKHRIAAGSDYDWDGRGAMYGWRVERVMVLREPVPGPDRKGTINSKPVPRLVPRTAGSSPLRNDLCLSLRTKSCPQRPSSASRTAALDEREAGCRRRRLVRSRGSRRAIRGRAGSLRRSTVGAVG